MMLLDDKGMNTESALQLGMGAVLVDRTADMDLSSYRRVIEEWLENPGGPKE